MKSPKHFLAMLCLASAAFAVPSLASAGVSVSIGVAPPHHYYHQVRPLAHRGYVHHGYVYRQGWQHARPGYRAESWHRYGDHRAHRGWQRSHGSRHGHGHR